MSAYDKALEKGICGFCGKYEKCSGKRHTRAHLRDLLVDANLIEDTENAFFKWFHETHKDPENFLLGHSPEVVFPVYQKRVAFYVRSIL